MRKKIQELHQHKNEKGIPFGKAHPVEAFHRNVVTRYNHDITLLTEVILAKGVDDIYAADLRRKKYAQV